MGSLYQVSGQPDTLNASGTMIQGNAGGASGVPRSLYIQRSGPYLVWHGPQGERYQASAARVQPSRRPSGSVWQSASGGLCFALDGYEYAVSAQREIILGGTVYALMPAHNTPDHGGDLAYLTGQSSPYAVPAGMQLEIVGINLIQTAAPGVPASVPLTDVCLEVYLLPANRIMTRVGSYQSSPSTFYAGQNGAVSVQGEYIFPTPYVISAGNNPTLYTIARNNTDASYIYRGTFTIRGRLTPA